MDPLSITLGLGSLLLPLFGRGGNSSTTTAMTPEMEKQFREMFEFQKQRMYNMDPLQQAVVAMAMGMLPSRYQQPVSWGAPAQVPTLVNSDVRQSPGAGRDTTREGTGTSNPRTDERQGPREPNRISEGYLDIMSRYPR